MHDGGGDDQIDTVLATLPLPFEAVVLGLEGEPVEGVEVAWSAPYGTLSAHLDTTDADGVTRVTLALSDEARTHPVQASVENLQGSPVVFTADAEPGALAALTEYHDTDGQIGAVGERLDFPYSVVARDAHGNAKRGVLIDWSVASGGGSVDPDTQTTDYDDYEDEPYALAYHTLGPDEGMQAVIASAPGPGGTVELEFESRAVSARVDVVHDYYYDPHFESDSVSVPAGRTVGWVWRSYTAHNVTFEDDPTTPVSSDTQESGHHLRTFDVPGQYRYRCTVHSTDFTTGMTGVVVVE
jgi:plastocyanin